MAYAARARNCFASKEQPSRIGCQKRESVKLGSPAHGDDVAVASHHRVEKVGNGLQRIGHFGLVSRLVVAGVQTTADASVSE
jgi:hypothetical protein